MRFQFSRFKKKVTLVVAVVLLGLTLFYVAANRENVELTEETRKKMGGTYIKLQTGVTHYELSGPKDAPVVVLIHGYTISIWDFDLQMQPLLDAGFQVLRYDALGRGLSDRPLVPYTRALYVKQLSQLISALFEDSPVQLVGHSLGGAIAMQYARENPTDVTGIVLVSPVVNSVHAVPPVVVCNTPIIGDFLLRIGMVGVLQRRALAQWDGVDVDKKHYADLFEQQISIKGFEHSLCSMFRTDMVGDYRQTFKKVGQQKVPGLLVFGDEDTAVWKSDIESIRPHLVSFTFEEFKGGGHSEHVQNHQKFNSMLVSFLTQQ